MWFITTNHTTTIDSGHWIGNSIEFNVQSTPPVILTPKGVNPFQDMHTLYILCMTQA